jgi:hypothetical protein
MTDHLITLDAIRAHSPCESGWKKLISALGTSAQDTVLSIGDVAKANGAADAFWCLRCIDDPKARVRAVLPAVKRASVHTTDSRVHDCIATIERWLDDLATINELRAAAAGAGAAWAAAWAARAPGRAEWAAECAAWAAEAAAEAAAWAAQAAWAAEAAWAAQAAAEAAAWAAQAAWAAAAAWAAQAAMALDNERAHQVQDLISLFPLHALKEKSDA